MNQFNHLLVSVLQKKLLIFLSLLNTIVFAQNRTISGTVYDRDTKAPIEFCNVVQTNGIDGTLTDEDGNFSLNIREGIEDEKLIFSTLGYQAYALKILPNENAYKVFLKQEGIELESIVVTGVGRATFIIENPISITTISSENITKSSENNIMDALAKNVPGLTTLKTGPNISKPFIHGLGYNRVLTLYDGIRQEGQAYGDEHGLEIDDYGIEKVEVAKGPASLLYGSDALAGVINIFPYLPKDNDGKLHGRIISEFQSNNDLIGNDLHLNYSDGKFILALRGSYRMAKNYRNPIDGRVYLSNFNVSNFSTTAGYKSSKGYTHLNFTLFNNHQGIPDGSRDSLSRAFTKEVFDDDDIKNRPLVTDKELNSYKVPGLSQHIQHYRAFLHSFYELRHGNIDVLLGGQQNVRREYSNPEALEQAGMYMRLNTLNYGIRYNAPILANIETTIGVNGMLQANKHLNATDFPIPNYQLHEGGGFLYGKWKKNQWTISGGIREDIRYVQWDDFHIAENPENGFEQEVTDGNISNAELQYPAFKNLYNGTSGSIGATFKATKCISFKANIGRAYRAPNLTEIGSNGLDPGAHIIYIGNRDFKPEFSLQEDIGMLIKHKNFSADISFFNNNISNFIYMETEADESGTPILDAQGNRTYHYKQSKAHLYGSDICFAIHPKILKGLYWGNNISIVYGFNRNSEYKGKNTEGEYLPLIPPLQAVSKLSYNFEPKYPHLLSINPFVEAEYNAKQNRYLGLNGTETATPSFLLFNIGATADIQYRKNNKLSLVLQANNLFDTAYQSHLNRLKYFEYYNDSPNGRYGIYNMGRNITIKAIIPF